MESFPEVHRNFLLSILPTDVQERLFSKLELVELEAGRVIYESHMAVTYVYFPIDCVVSTLCEMEDGETVEIAIVGNDGLVGATYLLGGDTSPNRTLVQCAGRAYRLRGRVLKSEFDLHGDAYEAFLRYVQILLIQSSQTALCYRHHTVEQQLCRWLLLSIDRLDGNTVRMTQQLIANNLGVRREGVTYAARTLQKLGLISCRRGGMTVVDRAGLEQRCCECYGIVKKESDRLLKIALERRSVRSV